MKIKPILKKLGGVALSMIAPLAFPIGINMMFNQSPVHLEYKKQIVLQDYQFSAEYQEIIQNIEENKAIGVVFSESTEDYYSIATTEALAVKYGGSEINDRLNAINEEIEEQKAIAISGAAITLGSLIFCYPLTKKGMDMVLYTGPDFATKDGDPDYYNSKEVII